MNHETTRSSRALARLAPTLLWLVAGCAGATTAVPLADAGPDTKPAEGVCVDGGITFNFDLHSSDYSCFAGGGCGGIWLSITGPDGNALSFDSCQSDCTTCEPSRCGCPVSRGVAPGSMQRTWNGSYTAISSCTSSQYGALACGGPACAPPGQYVAMMCASDQGTPLSADAGLFPSCGGPSSLRQVCTQAAFTWPPALPGQTIDGSLTLSPDGG